LTLNAQLAPVLTAISADASLQKYVQPLQHLTVLRLLQQLARVFRTMKLDKFLSVAPAMPIHEMERLIMEVRAPAAH